MATETISFDRRVPVRYDVDVFVAGGGPAGVAAALTASRQGARVFLAEGSSCFGGMGTAGLVPAFMCFSDGLHFLAAGIGEEIYQQLKRYADLPIDDPASSVSINVEALKRYIAEKEQSFHIQLDKEPVRDEVLLKQGFMFGYTHTPQPEFTKNEVVLVRDAHKESLLCLDAVIAPETVDYLQTHKDRFFICLELALDTTKKWNLKHHLGDKLKTV